MTGRKITPGKTLLFLDEVQTCPKAIMALRYFYEEIPDLHVIAAGSLLEFALGEISFPVGRVNFLNMYPLTFTEFLNALSFEKIADLLFHLPENKKDQISETIHQAILEKLRLYFFVGGMPEAVATYVKTGSLQECFSVHADLIHAYRQDFSKYKPAVDPMCLDMVLKNVAKKGGQQITYTHLAEGFSQPTIKKAFDLLNKAGMIHEVRSTSPQGLPLGTLVSAKRLKALIVDLGLMNHLCSLSFQNEWAKTDLLSICEGALAEQFVGQEFLAACGKELFYWSRAEKSSAAEVDYLIVRDGKIYPVEVKSGPSGRLKSLHLLLKTYPNVPEGFVLSSAPYSRLKDQKLTFYPLYYAFAVGQK